MRNRLPSFRSALTVLSTLFVGSALAAACAESGGESGETSTAAATTTTASGTGGATSSSTTGQGGDIISGPTGTGGGTTCNPGSNDDDADGDGFSENEMDCNDCDALVNPDAVEVIAEPDDMGNTPKPADEDCDGKVDVLAPPCDGAIALDTADPLEAAKAIGACKYITKASWVQADGLPPPNDAVKLANYHLGHGVVDDLGANNPPREGTQLLVLSSGTARRETDPGFVHRNFDKGYQGNAPFGFPKESASCPGVTTGAPHDSAALEVEFKAPSNAKGVSFDFNFFTFEWPKFICTEFNDFFVALMSPIPMGQTDGDISFDQQGNPISVNNAFLQSCGCPAGPPCAVPPGAAVKSFDCSLGKTLLQGTDFDNDDTNPGWTNGATGWLRTTAPVAPNTKFTIRFATYDSDDGFVDSTVLIDNWMWSAKPGTIQTVIPD
jgi:hypothetical protein